MAELCYNNGRFTKAWFQNLTGIQQCMANLNHLTKSNTKDFSKQTLNELLMSKEPGFDNRKGALNMYCQGTLKLLVPDDAYQDMSKNFLWFLGYISIDVKDRLKSLLYCVAQNFNPDLFPDDFPPKDFLDNTISQAYKNIQFDNNPALKSLDRLLRENVNPAFYTTDSILRDLASTLKDVIDGMVN
jgi:hypothetical protein